MRLFVDTSAFLALEDRSDRCYPKATDFYEKLTPRERLWTSSYVLDETITRLRYTLGHGPAVQFAEIFLASKLFHRVYVDADLERAAIGVLKKYKDKKLSFTDCITVAILHAEKLDGVFAFDEDFRSLGFQVFP